ncbi:MAG: hypothetical protein JWO13_4107 [Acidobacteriales bacterium]|nr:hypothetical protein [Terriglobales bacterium]
MTARDFLLQPHRIPSSMRPFLKEEIEADPDCTEPGVSIACQKAKIVAIHKIPGKVIKKNQKRMRAALRLRKLAEP